MSNYTHVTANGSTLTVDEALAYAERNGVSKPDYMSLEDAAQHVRENYPQFSDLALHTSNPDGGVITAPEGQKITLDPDSGQFAYEPVTEGDEAAAREQIVKGLRTLGHKDTADALSGVDSDEFDALIIMAHEHLSGEEEENHGFKFLDALIEPTPREITVTEFVAAATVLRGVL